MSPGWNEVAGFVGGERDRRSRELEADSTVELEPEAILTRWR